MRILLLDVRSQEVREVTTAQLIESYSQPGMLHAFIGTRELLVIGHAASMWYLPEELLDDYQVLRQEGHPPLTASDLVIAGWYLASRGRASVHEWGCDRLRVFTPPELLDGLMELMGITEEEFLAEQYRSRTGPYTVEARF